MCNGGDQAESRVMPLEVPFARAQPIAAQNLGIRTPFFTGWETREVCTCSVIFRSLDVHDTGEASEGEWQFQMMVNGVMKTWNHDDVREQTYTLNIEFQLPNCDTPIDIRTGGWERDEGSKSGGLFDWFEDNDDPLSETAFNFSAPTADPSILRHHERRSSNRHGDYTIHFEIMKICKEVRYKSWASLLQDMRAYSANLKQRKIELRAKTDDDLVGLALDRLRRSGWTIVGVASDGLMLEGYMPIGKRERLKAEGKGQKK